MIEIKNYSIGFNGKELLTGCNSAFHSGTLTALIGRNGAGKSTLLRSIIGLESRYCGDIAVDGVSVKSMSPRERARRMALVATRRERVPGLTCRQAVELGRTPYTSWSGALSEADHSVVDEALESVGMASYASRRIDTLSDGEYQKIMIARALAQDSGILLLDEPTNGLDPDGIAQMRDLFLNLKKQMGTTIIISSHILGEMQQTCDRVAFMANGEIKAVKSMEEVNYGVDSMRKFAIECSDLQKASELISEHGLQTSLQNNAIVVIVDQAQVGELVKTLVQNDIVVYTVNKLKRSLEDLYKEVSK